MVIHQLYFSEFSQLNKKRTTNNGSYLRFSIFDFQDFGKGTPVQTH